MGDHDTPSGLLRHVRGLNRFRDGTNLVDLQQKSIAVFLINTSLDSLRVSDKKIVTDNLDFATEFLLHEDPSFVVRLVKGIFDGDDGVLINKVREKLDTLFSILDSRFTSLGTKVIGLICLIIELRGSYVETNLNLSLMS